MESQENVSVDAFIQTVPRIWQTLQDKVARMVVQLEGKSPHATNGKQYDDQPLDVWTSGFWPGMLWIMYDMTSNEHYRDKAWNWDEKIEQCFLRTNRFHHDVGFQFLSTSVIKYKLTGDADARRRALFAANFLAGRFNLAGQFIRAQNDDKIGRSIIDTTMNLSILYWASEESSDPRFKQIATAHAKTILQHFVREDGSVRHVIRFNPETGEYAESIAGQGFAPESAWSRGQAWAIYGLANVSRYTGDRAYLNTAQKVANYFISALPEDAVPYWDFHVPNPTVEPRDSSAAACAASGLIEIANQLPEVEAKSYMEAACRILESLTHRYAEWDDPDYEGILLGGTGHKPAGRQIDVSLIYGDYFYLESIAKLMGWKNRIY